MMPKTPEQQLVRLALVGASATLIIGGLLWISRELPTARTPVLSETPATIAQQSITVVRVKAAPLPTIERLATAVSTLPLPVPTVLPSNAATYDTNAASRQMSTTDQALAEKLALHLACISPYAYHDTSLDAQATKQAHINQLPLPSAGVMLLESADTQQLLLSADVLTDLRETNTVCGETWIFGPPPLDWLPAHTRFGIGLISDHNGARIVVLLADG